jgi:aryl-alcohol dehydrogenase-like predicted oxidoreductase
MRTVLWFYVLSCSCDGGVRHKTVCADAGTGTKDRPDSERPGAKDPPGPGTSLHMRYVRLGKTELQVSDVALGTWEFGGEWGSFDRDEAKAVIHRALDLGVTFFDTAQAYGFGTSERVLGEALWERVARDDVVIATKGGLRREGDRVLRDSSPEWLAAGVESSLRELGTDHIDLYQIHWPDRDTPLEETGEALRRLVADGGILHVGVSNFDAAQMDALSRSVPVEALQPPYHMFRRGIEEEILPYAAAHDIGVLVYGPLAHGLLSGRMTGDRGFAADDWRAHNPDFRGDAFARNVDVAARLGELAASLGVSLPRLAVAWTLSHEAVDVALVGARRPEQLDETVAASGMRLSQDQLRTIDGILMDAVPATGPSPEAVEL